jgi:peptide/nickel transport system permease protein
MRRYILKRLALVAVTLWGLSVLTFVISRIAPGDPARLAAGPQATEEMVAAMRHQFGLDRPLPVQYVRYVEQVARGNLGVSLMTARPVRHDLGIYFGASVELVLFSLFFATLAGIALGVLSAVYQNRLIDHLSRMLAITGLGMPEFWLALMLQLALASRFRLLPLSGRLSLGMVPPPPVTHLYLVDSAIAGQWGTFSTALAHLILPAIALSFPALASIIRISRADMLDTLPREFVRTARAKGLPERVVVWRHTLRNALLSSVTMIGLRFGYMLGGTVLVERVFDWPGIGLYMVRAAAASDFEPVMGVTLLVGLSFAMANLVVDLAYGALDPTIRYA